MPGAYLKTGPLIYAKTIKAGGGITYRNAAAKNFSKKEEDGFSYLLLFTLTPQNGSINPKKITKYFGATQYAAL